MVKGSAETNRIENGDTIVDSIGMKQAQQQQPKLQNHSMYTSLSKSDSNDIENTDYEGNNFRDTSTVTASSSTMNSASKVVAPRNTTTITSTATEPVAGGDVVDIVAATVTNIPYLICAIIASATTGGTSYAFGIYSNTLKHNLLLSQAQLDSISTSFFVAGLFTFIPGYCSDIYGTKVAMTLGGCTGSVSLLLYWYIAKQFVIIHSKTLLVVLLSILGITTFLSCGLVTGAVFKIIVTSTGSGTKGSAVGVAKGYVGLGAGLYACLFQAIQSFHESDLDFLPMAAILFIGCATIPAQMLLPSKQQWSSYTIQDDCTSYHFRTLYCSLIVLAVIIITTTVYKLYEETNQYHSNNNNGRSYGMTFVIISIWLGPIIALYFLPRATQHPTTITTNHRHDYDIVATIAVAATDDDTTIATSSKSATTAMKHQQQRNSIDFESTIDLLLGADEESTTTANTTLNNVNINSNSNNHDYRLAPATNQIKQDRRSLLQAPTTDKNATVSYDDDTERMRNENNYPHFFHRSNRTIDNTLTNAEVSMHGHGNVEEDVVVNSSNDNDDDPANMNLYQMIQTSTAMIMLYTTVILVGAGTVQTNNMGQMVESLRFNNNTKAITSTALAFFSVAQAASRVFTGTISESALNWNTSLFGIRNGIPRPFFMIVASLIGCIAHGILAYARTINSFVFGVTLSGVAFGMIWPLMVLISAELFGVNGAGQNYMFYDGVSSAGGTILMSKLIAQYVYDTNIDPNSTDTKTCLGIQCFQLTHIIVAVLCLSCCISSFILMYMSRHTYNKPILHTH